MPRLILWALTIASMTSFYKFTMMSFVIDSIGVLNPKQLFGRFLNAYTYRTNYIVPEPSTQKAS